MTPLRKRKRLKPVGKALDQALLGGIVTNVTEETEDAPKGILDKGKFAGGILASAALLYELLKLAIEFVQLIKS